MVCATSTCERSVGSARRDGAAGTAPCSREPGVACPAVSLLPADDPWAAYADTIVQIVRPAEGDFVTVRSAPVGEPRVEIGRWPWPGEDPVSHPDGLGSRRRAPGDRGEPAPRGGARGGPSTAGEPAAARRRGRPFLGAPRGGRRRARIVGARRGRAGRGVPAGGHLRLDAAGLVDRLVPRRPPRRLRLVSCRVTSDVVPDRRRRNHGRTREPGTMGR